MDDASLSEHYGPIGICIYCHDEMREPGETLHSEHIVPESLGGRLCLRAASCKHCGTAISKYERFIAQQSLDAFRVQFAVRKKNKRRPKRDDPVLFARYGENWREERLSIEEYPFSIDWPVLDAPAVMGTRAWKKTDVHQFSTYVFFGQRYLDEIRDKLGADRIEIVASRTNVEVFGLLLAKIAHAYAIAKLGLDGFQPFLDQVAFYGPEPRFPLHHLIGGWYQQWPSENGRHELTVRNVSVNGHEFVVVGIRLFADLGFAPFQVIAGFTNADRNPRLYQRLVDTGKKASAGLHSRTPSATLPGWWDYMCGSCTNTIIRGCVGDKVVPVPCNLCGALCVPNTPDRPFCVSLRGGNPRLSTFVAPSDLPARMETFQLGRGIITHFVSVADPGDENRYHYG